MRIEVKAVSVARQFEVRRYTGEDGYPAARVWDAVSVDIGDGRSYFLPQPVRREADEDGFPYWVGAYDAEAMAEAVRRKGSIDPALWMEVEPFDLEAELEAEYWREQDERMGWAA